MPLLKKKQFEKATTPEFLRDDEEVFYCQLTNEIFRDYDEFCQRVILCNSMVWSCSLTGKTNLTYAEALESEENARKVLSRFPLKLKVPVLFVANKTKRTGFFDMAEDVFLFVKDRYFIGESVESVSSGYKWKNACVVEIIPPTDEQIKEAQKNGEKSQSNIIPPSLYKYKIKQFASNGASRTIIVDYTDLKRKRIDYSRDKSKMFLKQMVEMNEMGIWCVKDSVMEEFGIKQIKFDDIFAGPEPDFDRSKKLLKTVNGKKVRQETISKFLQKTTPESVKSPSKKQNQEISKERNNLLEEMRKKEMEFKQKQAEEKLAMKQKKKESTVKVTMQFRDWYKMKDDLELNDQKPLPEFLPVNCKIPDKYMGDVLMLMEFTRSFSKVLYKNKFFPRGLTFDLMERALIEKEVAGPLIDIVQMFLCAVFNAQYEEASQYRTVVENSSGVNSEKLAEDLTVTNATYLATQASHFSVKYQGLSLWQLPMNSFTVTEILRLHLLSSGARINENGARWRYQQRGGYTNEDDPGLHFRLKEPHIIKLLATHSVVQLPIKYKLKILSCLMEQLLTYADVRDIIDQRLEQSRQAHADLKSLRVAERKRQQEYLNARIKVRQEDIPESKIDAELESMKRSADKKQLEYERKVEKLIQAEKLYHVLLGQDRAFRKYFKLEGVPGIFINFEESEPGVCLKEPVKNMKELVDAGRSEILAYLKKSYEDSSFNDKENHPKGSPKKVNGVRNSILQGDIEAECDRLLMCSANPENCIVHSNSKKTQRWLYLHDEHQIDELINSLNKRGMREGELIQTLQNEKDLLIDIVQKTPITQLNPILSDEIIDQKQKLRKPSKLRYDDANLGFPADVNPFQVMECTLVDYILDLEERIFAGNVGTLKVKNRNAWRKCLLQRNYNELDKTIVKLENGKTNLLKNEDAESRASTPDSICDDFADPGKYLGQVDPETSDSDSETSKPLKYPENVQNAVSSLAVALTQVARSIEPKYLKKPLGHYANKKEGKVEKMDLLEKWEQSLLASTSFNQIFLHYDTLDNCVMWSRSALLAGCKICRKKRDSENMLLCDNCNEGYHMYCLKPKLKEIPPGEWFCDKCLKQKELEEREKNPEPVKKKRRIFRDEDVDDEEIDIKQDEIKLENGKQEVEEGDEEEEILQKEESEEESQENGVESEEVCDRCGFGGELLCCDKCPSLYHLECVDPPLRRVPRGEWLCSSCKQKRERKRRREEVRMYIDPSVVQRPGAIINQRRCAARAQLKIHGFIKSLRRMSESEDSDSEELPTRRSSRRDEVRDDLPLHNAALQELLADVMKHKDAWPFIRPVQKTEVPDYYEVIAKPMDFGTIKYKLNMGEYKNDAELMADAVLVFENCNTYNDTDAEVYKCGVRLLKHFVKKSKELGLKLPEEMEDADSSDEESLQAKKGRIK